LRAAFIAGLEKKSLGEAVTKLRLAEALCAAQFATINGAKNEDVVALAVLSSSDKQKHRRQRACQSC
jgi:hypothetical protein